MNPNRSVFPDIKAALFTALVIIAALLTACNQRAGRTSADEEDAVAGYKELDKIAEEEINATNAAEARTWLAAPGNAIFEGHKADVVALTQDFYKAGCPKVYITGIENFGGTPVSASIVVVLPSDASQRAGAFKVENAFSEKQGDTGDQDMGQKYIWMSFD